MIIDMHVHIFKEGMWPKSFLDEIYEIKRKTLSKEEFEKYSLTTSAETLIGEMDEAGVDASVCLPIDFAFMCGQEPEISVWKANEYVAEAQQKYPGRIIGFVGVDPQRPDAVELLETGVKEWGLQGVKLFPGMFFPTEERIAPFIKKVDELDVPMLIHQGTDPLPYTVKYGDPRYIDELVLKYPKLRIIAAHSARGWEDLLVQMIVFRPNRIWTDLAALQYEYKYSKWHFYMQMRYLLDRIPDSVVLGSDWPFIKYSPLPSHKEWIDAIRELHLPQAFLDMGMKQFTEEEIKKVLGGNAQNILGLK